MFYPPAPRRQAPGLRPQSQPQANRPWTVNSAPRPAAPTHTPLTRRYEMSWLDEDGELRSTMRLGPAIPVFENAFAAMARGALVTTPNGPVAVEDLLPGDRLVTRSGTARVRWTGHILLPPNHLRQDGPDTFRILAETFGLNRPAPDLVLCEGARIVHRAARLPGATGGGEVLVPIADFADGMQVIEINPVSAIDAYHLVLDRHDVIEANGMAIESYHPGREIADELTPEYLALFRAFFPFAAECFDFRRLALPRMGLEQIESYDVA